MIAIVLLSAILALAVWIPATSSAGVIVFAIFFGFSSGGFISLGPTLIAQISDISQIGTRLGTAFAFQAVGALCGSPIGGAIESAQHGKYWGLQLFSGCTMLLSCCALIVVRYTLQGFKPVKV